MTRLCVFMERQSTNDLLLPLLITFLNDRDASLRAAFFDCIMGVCAFVGRASLQAFVLPCILQVRALPRTRGPGPSPSPGPGPGPNPSPSPSPSPNPNQVRLSCLRYGHVHAREATRRKRQVTHVWLG